MKTSIVCTYFMSGEIKEFKKKKKKNSQKIMHNKILI